MRSPARLVTGTAAAALTAAVLGLAAAPSAHADDPGRLGFAPATAAPGAAVTVTTTACGAAGAGFGDAAELEAGEFELGPGTSGEAATGRFTVPQEAEPGSYAVGVFCDDGKEATGDLEVTAASAGSSPAVSPTGSSARPKPGTGPEAETEPEPGTSAEPWTRPEPGTTPGAGTGTVPDSGPEVRPEPATPSGAWPDRPSGHVRTGVGGSVGPDTTRIAAGAGVLGAATLAGVLLVRRRAHGIRRRAHGTQAG
ncbi:hypothetical protein [Streptomyces sp. B1I3]|uniref:hypothetical protein n=1 Tax=Streptomyces sp. B1I3 TaxID=3042264 RepID=UPI002782458F|nr:hypothetical protein [Streptomyces sp. B1I3]MDQ0796485.1 hypothetical protein [Streptomyces sp. B1I3]